MHNNDFDKILVLISKIPCYTKTRDKHSKTFQHYSPWSSLFFRSMFQKTTSCFCAEISQIREKIVFILLFHPFNLSRFTFFFFTVIIVRLKQHLSIFPSICKTTYRLHFLSNVLEHERMNLDMNLKLLFLRMKKQKKERSDFCCFIIRDWYAPIYVEKCRDEKQFFSIIEEVFEDIRRNRGQNAKNRVRPGNTRNDSTIRLNKQRKVFNYSVEIFIKKFSHYFTLFFGTKFFRCLWKLEESGREEDTRKQHYFIRIENLTTQI